MANLSYQAAILNGRTISREIDTTKANQGEDNYFSFKSLVNQFPNIPEATALLGKAGKMPILFDLEDPRPGSILLINDHLPSIRKFMTVMMKSLVHYSHSSSVQFITISHYPDKWMDLIQEFDPEYSYCAGVSGDFENSAEDWILYLAKKADDRISGRNNGPAAILFIDDCELVQNLDIRVRINFDWLLKNGSSSRIWIVSGLDISKNPQNQHQIEFFKTKIFGNLPKETSSTIKSFAPVNEVAQLGLERNFITKIGSNWIRFWAPKLQG